MPAVGAGIDARAALTGIPADQRYRAQTPDLQHKGERGDSLSVIAARYSTSVSELMALNNLKSRHRIRVGQMLNLPYRGRVSRVAIAAGAENYVVQRGDTVSMIARRAGIGEAELLAINSLSDRNRIYPGQQLILIADVNEIAAAPAGPVNDGDEIIVPAPASDVSTLVSADHR